MPYLAHSRLFLAGAKSGEDFEQEESQHLKKKIILTRHGSWLGDAEAKWFTSLSAQGSSAEGEGGDGKKENYEEKDDK